MTEIKAADIAKALAQSAEDQQESEYRSKAIAGMDEAGETIEGELKRVLIQRGDERVVTDVPEHEVEILQAIFGFENVEVTDEDVGTSELPNDAGQELARLKQKYDRRDAPVIQSLYPRGAADLATALGMTDKGKASAVASNASIKERRPARKTAAKKPAKKPAK